MPFLGQCHITAAITTWVLGSSLMMLMVVIPTDFQLGIESLKNSTAGLCSPAGKAVSS